MAENPDGYREERRPYELKYYYNITQEDFDKLRAEQNDSCAICKKKPEKRLAVDHDHESGDIRGLLCRRCNSAIGLFDDDPAKVLAAVLYLLKAPAIPCSGEKPKGKNGQYRKKSSTVRT